MKYWIYNKKREILKSQFENLPFCPFTFSFIILMNVYWAPGTHKTLVGIVYKGRMT